MRATPPSPYRRLLLLLLLLLLGSPVVWAQDAPSCQSPRDAAASLLDWLQPSSWDPAKAATCLDVSPEQAADRTRLAIQLKQVLDARGLYVPVGDLPTDAGHRDAYGEHRVVPVPALPVVVLEKVGDRWLFSRGTLQGVPGLYRETFSAALLTLQEHLPPVFFTRLPVLNLLLWQGLYFVLLVAAALAVGWLAQVVLARQILRVAERLHTTANKHLLRRIRTPLTWSAAGLVFLWGVPELQLGVRASFLLHGGATAILALAVVVMAARIVDLVSDLFARHAQTTQSKLDDQVIPLASRALKVGLWTLGVVFILQNLGVEVTALLAGVSVGGVAVALAAQDTVSNLFGSLTIFTDRPFQIGDWVIIDDKTEGVVEEVGFRSTRIRTFHSSVVSVPNAKVANCTVDNMGRRQYRRLRLTLGLPYSTPRDKMLAFVHGIRSFMQENPRVRQDVLEIHFHAFGPSSLEVLVYCFFIVPSWHEELVERERCLLEFMRIAEEVGVSFAFPSTSIYFENPLPPQTPDA